MGSGRPAKEPEPLVAVLGSAGLVGSAVTGLLSRRPLRLRAVSRRPSTVLPGARAQVEVRTADLTVRDDLAAAVAGADSVIHLVMNGAGWRAAATDADSERVNVGIMRDLIDLLADAPTGRRPPAVIFAGASSQVGPPPRVPIDGTEPDRPGTVYDRQKLAAEHMLMSAAREGAVRGISLRLPTVFGHGPVPTASDRGVLATMIRKALAGEALTVWHRDDVKRDVVYVQDIASAFEATLDHADALSGRHWLVGSGRGESLRDLFQTIAELVSAHTGQPPVPVVSVPAPPHATGADLRSRVIDSSAFRSVTGWRPRTPLRDALARTVAALADAPVRRPRGIRDGAGPQEPPETDDRRAE